MADIRINSLPTTASASSSDDFLALDGATNGTRKLNAYSPTFGGNLTVSGTGTFSGNLSATGEISCNGSGGALRADSRTGSGLNWYIYNPTGADLRLFNSTGGNVLILTNAGAATLAGNLTVSGTGTSSFQSTTPPTVQIANTTSGLDAAANTANGVLLGTLKFGHPSDGQAAKFPSIVGRFSLTNASFARNTALDFYTSNSAGPVLAATFTEAQNLLIGTTTDRSNRVHIAAAGPSYIGMGQLTSTYAGIVFGDVTLADSASGFNIAGNAANSNLVFNVNTGGSMNWRVGNANAFTLSSGGNFLIGGTIDGGNGNLQLKDTSGSSTKGIGFGTDLSLYRANTGFLILNDASAALDARIGLYNNGIQRGLFEAYNVGTAVYIGAASASWSTIITSGNGTTALTLDSSQNATVVGTLTAKGRAIVDANGDSNARQFLSGTASSGAMITDLSTYAAFKSRGAGGVYLLDASNNQLIKAEATTGNTSILGSITTSAPTGGAGAWELGVYSATAPTATGYVTIEIGGVQYKLLAST